MNFSVKSEVGTLRQVGAQRPGLEPDRPIDRDAVPA